MENSKWFFPLQKRVNEYLKEKYQNTSCNWQDVCKTTVHENYTCIDKQNQPCNVHVVMYKHGFIQFYKADVAFSVDMKKENKRTTGGSVSDAQEQIENN